MNWFQWFAWFLRAMATPAGPVAQPAPQSKPTITPGSIFDDFDGPAGSTPDPQLWAVASGTIDGIAPCTPDNVYLDGQGHLAVSAKKDTSWTTGALASWGKQTFGYGLLQASIKMPTGQGLDSGFWLLGPSYSQWVPYSWPGCGEVDIMEYIDDGEYHCTVHGPMYASGNGYSQAEIKGALGFNPSTDFHTYWCSHLPGSITFGIDNTTLGTVTPKSIPAGAPWVCDQPFDVLFSIVVGSGFAGNTDLATPNPAVMLVDWFYWQPAPVN